MTCYLDTCIIIDLEKLGLLDKLDSLNIIFVVSKFVIHDEIIRNKDSIFSKLNKKIDLTKNDLECMYSIPEIKIKHKRLSKYDCLGLLICKKSNYVMVTSDQNLRKTCQIYNIEVHGVIWLLDMLIDNLDENAKNELLNKIKKIKEDPNFRLPKDNVDRLIKQLGE